MTGVGVTETTGVTWLTQEAYDRLKAELEFMSGDGRSQLAKKIEEARLEGDLKENGGYHAAKEEQGRQEARIRQLRQLLEHAQVGDAPASSDGSVVVCMVATVELAGDDETFLLGSREVAGDTDLDVYSEKSPLGAAILGCKVGDKVSYTAPNGREIPVVVKAARPFGA
jgi:transcription elongation factor GreA